MRTHFAHVGFVKICLLIQERKFTRLYCNPDFHVEASECKQCTFNLNITRTIFFDVTVEQTQFWHLHFYIILEYGFHHFKPSIYMAGRNKDGFLFSVVTQWLHTACHPFLMTRLSIQPSNCNAIPLALLTHLRKRLEFCFELDFHKSTDI